MVYNTGVTIYDNFISVDVYNNPVVPANFENEIIKDGILYNATTININLIDSDNGIYNYNFTPNEFGSYQVYIKNLDANLIYVSDIFNVKIEDQTAVYVGL
jgi:hypothetical protein